LSYYVQPMQREDVVQVSEIDREAFPTLWPPVNYEKELRNPLAHCIVACDNQRTAPEMSVQPVPKRGLSLLVSRLRGFFNRNRCSGSETAGSDRRYVVGFAGLWIMADEAHITNIAVRESYQRQGVGELLLLSAVDLAIEQKANTVTLEVRASNTAAQALYRKYYFNQVGVRRGYYIDNKEDAILMSTEDIRSAPFKSKLQKLKEAHFRKLGITP
jgi:ribosomal-protein-alanine N-acetyltransferase